MKIKTKTEKEFTVNWAGISTLDNSFKIGMQNLQIYEAMKVFADTEETEEIKVIADNPIGEEIYEKTYLGYTTLIGINIFGEETVISLIKGVNNNDET